ncbi:hypothetical protein HPB48_017347 [Haemaphysalis longicornis]|uniref:DUF7041 domain-containing protein n=1 Tax=Haemaphysalis longicornis TaxID=44386 RepID=A0A9J6GZD6_HAELO|nr:hypothetical protein HPB48_017347 [Haemaphysalis longicornis]
MLSFEVLQTLKTKHFVSFFLWVLILLTWQEPAVSADLRSQLVRNVEGALKYVSTTRIRNFPLEVRALCLSKPNSLALNHVFQNNTVIVETSCPKPEEFLIVLFKALVGGYRSFLVLCEDPFAKSMARALDVVQLRLPTFVRKNPHIWFAQVEVVFDLHRVTSETTWYPHLLCNLPPEVTDEVADVIGAPLNDAPYQLLKQSILDRTTVSASARLRHLLTHEELGDRRPSQLLNTMRQLVGASNVDSNGALLKERFLQRLPQSTSIVLAAAGDMTLDLRR